MCNCSENESSERRTQTPPTSAAPAMRPLVPLSRQVRINDMASSEDGPAVTQTADQGTVLPVVPCRLDFREGCYQINFRPTASLVTFEGTLRVDRSAPDGGPDHLIVSGDLYSRLPVIGPISPASPAPVGDADEVEGEGNLPAVSLPMSVAGALSTADSPLVPVPIHRPTIPIFPRARYHSY